MLKIDANAFLKDLHDLRTIGQFKTGVSRPTYSPQDMESRRWLMDRMRSVGLAPSIDGIGNVFGHHPGAGPHILTGSHIESQLEAGWLDGALGVVAGVALARAGLPVDVCAFADEEGHFSLNYIGSRSIIGEVSEEEIDRSRGRDNGPTLRSALADAGLDGIPRMQIDPARYKGFFEMHIEQGSQLERDNLRIGVVTGIVGIRSWQLIFEGQQGHAGGVMMNERRDAGLAAVRLLAAVDREFPRVCGDRSVWSTSLIRLEPGVSSIIPGQAEVWFQFRDISPDALDDLEATLKAIVRECNRTDPCAVTLNSVSAKRPVMCDRNMMRALSDAAENICLNAWREMPSGAGHDAEVLARKLPVAMLFVPSIGGISHHWTENTSDADLALGLEVLTNGVARFLSASS